MSDNKIRWFEEGTWFVLVVGVFIAILFMTSGCMILDECQPGEQEICECGSTKYINQCTMDGKYEDCDCYDNGGSGGTWIEPHPDLGGTMSGGDQDLLNHEYNELPTGLCNDDEVGIPGTVACLRICPAGMDWLDGQCVGYHYTQTYEHVLAECKKHDPRYEIISTKQIAKLLDQCYPDTFDWMSVNRCSPYLTSPIRFALQFPNYYNSFNTWVGDLVVCDDAYGYVEANCALDADFSLTTQIDTTFNLLRASAQYGSAMSGGLCVRE